MKRIMLIGANGQIGHELASILPLQAECLIPNRSRFDLANPDQLRSTIREFSPDIVVNAAAYTAVDKAELDEATATVVNAVAPGVIAETCKQLGACLIHFSTDYVFDGLKASPYVETDRPNPLNAYGRSKLAGEVAIRASGARHLILRTSWVYGPYGSNFLLTMLKIARERDVINVVADQHGTPNWSKYLADAVSKLVEMEAEGLYHLSCRGETTWFGFAEAIFARTQQFRQQPLSLLPISTNEYPLPARRPGNSQLSGAALKAATGIELPCWQEALSQCLSGFRTFA